MKTIITTISLVILLQFSFTTTVNAVDVRQTCIEGLAENSDLIFSQSEYNTLLNDCIKKFSKYEAPPKKWEEDPKYAKRRSVLGTVFKLIGIFVLVLIGYLPFALITYFGTECGVTNKRVVSKKGIISRNVSEMNLTSIESVNIDQGVLGRVLKVGTLKISGRGTTAVVFSNIDDPISIRKLIQNKN